MKEIFAESIKGLNDLIIRQVTRVEEEFKRGRKCQVSVRRGTAIEFDANVI
jgi:hypothetical protein